MDALRERTTAAASPAAETFGRLDDTLAFLSRWDAERLAWAALLLVAVLSRVIGLGQRAISYDESLHALFSWKLFQGQGYQHEPLTHGPLKFELTAFLYFLFGVNDWTSRFGIALFGIGLVWAVWWLRPWLGRTGAFVAAALCTISPALLFYSRYLRDEVALCALSLALVITTFRYLETRRPLWLYLTAVVLALAFATTEVAFILGGLFGLFFVLVVAVRLWHVRRPADWGRQLRTMPEMDVSVLLATLALPFLSGALMVKLGWQVGQLDGTAPLTGPMMAQGGLVLMGLLVASAAVGWLWLRERWLAAAGLFWGSELLLFTTFLTSFQGIYTGFIGSLGYWIDQQAVRRGDQPWYYFLLIVPLYEFLPLTLAGGGGLAWVGSRLNALNGRMGGWESGRMGDRKDTLRLSPSPTLPFSHSLFPAFLVYWTLATWVAFTYVGEKMPWHVVYFALPMALLGGWWLGRLIDSIEWGKVRAAGGLWLLGLLPVFLVALKAALPTSTYMPFAGVTIAQLDTTMRWLLAAIATLALGGFLWRRAVALGWPLTGRLLALGLAALLGILTVAVAFRLAFVDYDYATEPLVYAHGTPDLTLAARQIALISRETSGDLSLQVAYDDDTAWPLEWYLRDYANRIYYGATPTAQVANAAVVIAGDQNRDKVLPLLGNRYYELDYRLIWWPRQTYFGLTWQRIWDGIRDPVQRGEFWDVVLYRRYTTPTAQWEPVHRFSVFVRKDVAAQVWDWAGASAVPGGG